MDMIKDEISSIVFENEVEDEDQLSSLCKEISSISESFEVCVNEDRKGLSNNGFEVKVLREKLTERVYHLHEDLKFLVDVNRNEGSTRRDSINMLEILEQISSIKSSVDGMKEKLRESQELVVKKTLENEYLKDQLTELETHNFTSNGRSVVCHSCRLF